jgi:UDP-N-acetylglucosamine 2-epimerase (non-hydrolysing)
MKKKLLFVFGTRPEAIKMIPLILYIKDNHTDIFDIKVCVTGQHRQMLDQILSFFNVVPDIDLNLMQENQTLFSITSSTLLKLKDVIEDVKPDLVLVQGDTTTAFTAALASYYLQVKTGHVEAGLRSYEKYSPFPEEINRKLIGQLADIHFAPTERAKSNLLSEGVTKNICVTTNTVIDALLLGIDLLNNSDKTDILEKFKRIDFTKKIILVTAHRRESFGKPFKEICRAIKQIAKLENVEIIYPVHLNPNVKTPVEDLLSGISNVHLIEPLEYRELIWVMSNSYLVLTDSGGIQEEAPSLGKPVLVMRNVSERQEGIEAGCTMLVGNSCTNIIEKVKLLLNNQQIYNSMSTAKNPYGIGEGSAIITKHIIKFLEIK